MSTATAGSRSGASATTAVSDDAMEMSEGMPWPDPVRQATTGRTIRRGHLTLVPSGDQVPGSSSLRLTRAGRLVLTGLALVVTFVVALVVLSVTAPSAPVIDHHVTVQSGETLSGIAARELPSLSVANGVARIRLANNMSSPYVAAGQDLAIPRVP